MSSIDERIVEMKFNNSQFESGVRTTTSSLDKLKQGLNLNESARSLSNLQSVGDRFSLAGIANGVSTVASRFTALGTVGVAALATITAKAVSAGTELANSLTLAPIKAGFDEYELTMGSIQTILANTARYGTKLPEVTKNLDELNNYADKTIYNFGQMTKNIGLFTNSGLRVGEATSIIKGFSNEAAASGTSAEGAASAAYQLSQALSAGTIRLMDFRSLTNVGLGNKNMQNGLIEIADAMGTLKSSNITGAKVQSNFNASLEKGWLSAGVMSTYLKIMAGDYSEAKQKQLGLTDEQIKAFKIQQKNAEEAATKVRTLSQLVGTLQESVGSTWSETFRILFGDFNEATDLFTNVNDTIGPIIASMGAERNKILKDFDKFGGRNAAIESISNIFSSLLAVLKPIHDAFVSIFPPATGKQLADIAKSIATFTESLKIGGSTANEIKRTFAGLFAILDIGRMVVVGLLKTILGLFGTASEGAGSFLDVTSSVGDFLVALRDAIKNGQGLQKFFEGLGAVLSVPVALITAIVGALGDLARGLNITGGDSFATSLGNITDKMRPLGVLAALLTGIWDRLGKSFGRVVDFFAPLAATMGDAFSNLGDAISNAVSTGDFNHVLDVVNTGLLGGLTLLIAKFFKNGFNLKFSADLGGGLFSSIKSTFEGLTGTLEAMQAKLKAQTLLTIAGAIAILTVSVVALSLIDSAALTKSLTAITVMFTELGVALALFNKITVGPGFAKMPVLAASLILLAIAIDVLAIAVKKLSSIDLPGLMKGLSGVIVLLGAIAATAQLMKGAQLRLLPVAAAMILLAIAVKVLASAVGDFASMDLAAMQQGLGGVAATLALVVGVTRTMGNPKNIIPTAAALVILGAALKILASAVKDFGSLDYETLGKGIGAMAASLTLIALSMRLMPTNLIVTAAGLVVVGAALKLIADAMKSFGGMSIDEIGKSIGLLAATLIILAASLYLMTGSLPGAAALIVAAGALAIMAPALAQFGAMPIDNIVKALGLLAASLIIIAGSLYLMTAALPGAAALIVAAAALAILAPVLVTLGGMSWEEIGKGLVVLAGALAIIGVAGALLTPVIPTLLGLGLAVGLLGAGMALAGVGVLAFAVGLTALGAAGAAGAAGLTITFSAILGLIPLALRKLGEGIIALADVIGNGAPAIVQALVKVFISLLNAIDNIAPRIVNTLVKLVMLMVNALATNIPKLYQAGLKMLLGILTAIANNIGKIVDAATNIIVNFINGIGRGLPKIINAGIKLIISFVNGLADGIRRNTAAMNKAGTNLASAIVDGMTSGLRNGVTNVINAAKNLAQNALDAAKNLLGIHSPSKEFEKLGEYSTEGYVNGLTGSLDDVKGAFDSMKGLLKDLLDSSTQDIADFQQKIVDLTATTKADVNAVAKQRAELKKAQADRKSGADVVDEKNKLEKLTAARARDTRELKDAQAAVGSAKTASARKSAKDRVEDLTNSIKQDTEAIKKQKKALADARADRKSGAAVKEQQDKLDKLIATRDKNNASLAEANDNLKTATDENKKANAATSIYNAQAAANQAQLEDLAAKNDDLTDSIKDQTKAVEDATKTRDDYNKSLKDQYSTLDSISQDTSLDTYFNNLEDQVTRVNEFTSKIQELRNRGLNDTAYTKLLSSGTDALPFLDQLLAKGQDGVAEFDQLTDQLAAASSSLGSIAATSLYQSGVDSAQGILNGLTSQQAAIQAKMTEIANSMVSAINDALGIKSPSRRFAETGGFAGQGLAKGLDDSSKMIKKSASDLGDAAIEGLKSSMSGIANAVGQEMDVNPTITPVLDLSLVKAGAAGVGGLFSGSAVSVDSSYLSAASASDAYSANQQALINTKAEVATASNSGVTFIQNNTSPKALSRAELYRQTKNQLSIFKGGDK